MSLLDLQSVSALFHGVHHVYRSPEGTNQTLAPFRGSFPFFLATVLGSPTILREEDEWVGGGIISWVQSATLPLGVTKSSHLILKFYSIACIKNSRGGNGRVTHDTIRYDTIRYNTIRYDMIWYDTIRNTSPTIRIISWYNDSAIIDIFQDKYIIMTIIIHHII